MRTLALSSAFAAATMALAGAAFAQDRQAFDHIERGRYLAVLGDCAGCHTTPNGKDFAGGLPLETPFGTIVSPNITPDIDTGIGGMTEQQFVASLHEGRGAGGKLLYPAMPYPAYTKLTDDDARDLRAYFMTVAPVYNKVTSNQLPFPFNIRYVMAFWNTLNFKPERFTPDPKQSAEWNRGAYIVEGPGHCGTCHTPKNVLGGDKTSDALQGGVLQGWYAPNITADAHTGLGGWSKDDIAQYLKTGANDHTIASGPMAEAITHSTSMMTDADVNAIAVYLKAIALAPVSKPAPLAAEDKTMRVGAAIYKDSCAACHKDSGMGESKLFPRLAGSSSVQSDDATTLARVVLQGTRAVATSAAPTGPAMPAFDWRLNDTQVAAVLTYIRNSWGNAAASVSAETIKASRAMFARGDDRR